MREHIGNIYNRSFNEVFCCDLQNRRESKLIPRNLVHGTEVNEVNRILRSESNELCGTVT